MFTQADNQLLEDDVFAKIEAVTAPSSGKGQKAPKRAPQTEEEFAALVPQVKQAVEASDTYVEGTLRDNGGVLTWEMTVGMPCTYNPRMEAKLHGTGEAPSAEERAALVGSSGRFTLEGGTVTDNRAGYGGGIAVTGNALCMLRGGNVTQNTAATDGGGIYADGGRVILTQTEGESVFANVPNDIAPKNDPSIFAFEILCQADHTGCRITADPPFACAGERVALKPVPGNKFWFESITAADAYGADLALTEEIDGTFTFTMPASVVTVHAAFTPMPNVPTAACSPSSTNRRRSSFTAASPTER